jgi:hypothetical protein
MGFTTSLYELSGPDIALNDRHTPPERLDLDRLFDNMRCMIGYIKVF